MRSSLGEVHSGLIICVGLCRAISVVWLRGIPLGPSVVTRLVVVGLSPVSRWQHKNLHTLHRPGGRRFALLGVCLARECCDYLGEWTSIAESNSRIARNGDGWGGFSACGCRRRWVADSWSRVFLVGCILGIIGTRAAVDLPRGAVLFPAAATMIARSVWLPTGVRLLTQEVTVP